MSLKYRMINIKLLSDVHLEKYSDYPGLECFIAPSDVVDIICLCGDIGDPTEASYKRFLEECVERSKLHTFVILGNHECYGRTIAKTVEIAEKVCHDVGAVFLNNTRFDLPEFKLRILGTTLWSELDTSCAWELRTCIADFQCIKEWGMGEWMDSYHNNISWLRSSIQEAEDDEVKLIVMTHHVPLMSAGDPKYAGSNIKSAFASNLRKMIEDNTKTIKFWFYGHDHYSMCTDVADTKVVSNQLGYQGENRTLFNTGLTLVY